MNKAIINWTPSPLNCMLPLHVLVMAVNVAGGALQWYYISHAVIKFKVKQGLNAQFDEPSVSVAVQQRKVSFKCASVDDVRLSMSNVNVVFPSK